MAKGSPRLGKGLDALISPAITQTQPEPTIPQPPNTQGHSPNLRLIRVDLVEPNPYQPRQHIDETALADLAKSIAESGVIQPIVVRQVGAKYQIIAGERRWRAASLAGMSEIPAIVRQADDEQMLTYALIENIHREDLNPIERAQAYRALQKMLDCTIEELARRVGQDRSTVSNYLRLLELDESIQALVRSGQLTMGHARALLGAPPEYRTQLARKAAAEAMSVRAVEKAVQMLRAAKPPQKRNAPPRPHIKLLEAKFSQTLGLRTRIAESNSRHAGRVIIYYKSLDDFDRICQALGVDLSDI